MVTPAASRHLYCPVLCLNSCISHSCPLCCFLHPLLHPAAQNRWWEASHQEWTHSRMPSPYDPKTHTHTHYEACDVTVLSLWCHSAKHVTSSQSPAASSHRLQWSHPRSSPNEQTHEYQALPHILCEWVCVCFTMSPSAVDAKTSPSLEKARLLTQTRSQPPNTNRHTRRIGNQTRTEPSHDPEA